MAEVLEFVVLLILHLARRLFGWMFKDFADTRWGSAVVKFLGFGPSPVSGDDYCLTFFCSVCPGKSSGKQQKWEWYLYRCSECGHQWAVYSHDYQIKLDHKKRNRFVTKVWQKPSANN